MESYLTLKGRSEGSYKEKGSKFIGFALPVDSEETVRSSLEELRKKYKKAFTDTAKGGRGMCIKCGARTKSIVLFKSR